VVFLAAAFFAVVFFAAAFLVVVFFAVVFLAAAVLAVVAFLAAAFFVAVRAVVDAPPLRLPLGAFLTATSPPRGSFFAPLTRSLKPDPRGTAARRSS